METTVAKDKSVATLQLKPSPPVNSDMDTATGYKEASAADLPKQMEVYRTLEDMPERIRQINLHSFLEIANVTAQNANDDGDFTPDPQDGYLGTREVEEKIPAKFLFRPYIRSVSHTYQAYDVSGYNIVMPPDILRAYREAKDVKLFDRFEIWEIDDDPYLIGVLANIHNRQAIDRFFLLGSWDETSFTP